MRTLRICLFQELPDILERDSNYLYLAYDKLLLFLGQNPYYDPFVICDEMPESPISGCLYILFDGSVKCLIGDDIVDVAEIEDEDQVAQLPALGTTYFVHADKRYLDLQYRRLQLPYQNGTYSLNVSMAKDIKFNEKTVIRYDGKTQRFYMDGEYDNIPRTYPFIGSKTASVETAVYQHCIHSNVKISKASNNMLQILDSGLYATIEGKAASEDYEGLVAEFEEYKEKTAEILKALQDAIDENESIVTEDSIMAMIMSALEDYYSDIDALIDFYDSVGKTLEKIEQESIYYTDEVFGDTQEYLSDLINSSLNALWGTF